MAVQQVVVGKNTIIKGNAIFLEGETIQNFGIILQGSFDVIIKKKVSSDLNSEEKVLYCNNYTLLTVNKGEFIGISGLSSGLNAFTYIAKEDSIVFVYLASDDYKIKEILETQKEYYNYMMTSLIKVFSKTENIKIKTQGLEVDLARFCVNLEKYFTVLQENSGDSTNSEFFEDNKYKNSIEDKLIEEYRQLAESSFESFTSKPDIQTSIINIKIVSELIIESKSELLKSIDRINAAIECIFSTKNDCIYKKYVKLSNATKLEGGISSNILEVIEYTMNTMDSIIENLEKIFNTNTDYEMDKMKYLYKLALEYKPKTPEKILDISKIGLNPSGIPYELENSLQKILDYSCLPKELCDKYLADMDRFIYLLKNKQEENEMKMVKKSIEATFFIIYEEVLKNTIKDNSMDKLLDMFLNYAYMDERLLSNEEIIQLYCIESNQEKNDLCTIYTIRQWLSAVYKGEKEPSVDDFDLDYYDNFRQLRKIGKITDKEKASYYGDQERKLKFEILHLFKRNQKLCFGYPSTYFPILYSNVIVGDIDRAFVSSQKIIQSLKKIVDIDFSLFHREIFCHDVERGLEKEYIMKSVQPDIIITPIFGSKGVMWQPISGRDKSNPARFIIPAFTVESLDDMLINILGIFRWELGKAVMGVAWADVTQKSLTSEYADYIQFYRKNNDLSNEAKEKIKNQSVKNRNMLKGIFSSDYETWIKYEANGGIRLNKVVRAIMYKYCPFPKAIRQKLEVQGAFLEAANAYNRNKAKKVKELEGKINKLSKTRMGVPEELILNLEFYKDK